METSHSRETSDATHRNEGEFMRLLMRHEPALRAYARSLVPDWHAVDEVIQEASITLWQKFPGLREDAGFLPWAKVVVRFKCLSAISKLRRDRHVFSDEVLALLADEAMEVREEAHAEVRQALRQCLERFSAAHQELLLAPYQEHGRIKALASATQRSTNALYKLLGRLREKLARCIEKSLNQEFA